MDIIREKNRRRNKRKRIAIIFTLFTVSVVSMALCLMTLLSYEKQKNKALQAMNKIRILEEENSTMFSKKQLDEMVNSKAQEMLDKMQSMMEKGEGTLSLLQYFYPNHVIASDSGRYHFFPIQEKLTKNDFILENFTYPTKNEETGELEGETTYKIDEHTYARKGIDVSKFQGEIDWEKVKDDEMEYAIIRLGYRGYETGKMVVDDKYQENIEGSLEAGLDTGVYFFTEALTEKEAIEEADFVIENLGDYKINMPVVLDVEESASKEKTRTKDLTQEQRTKNVIAFCERIKEAGFDVMIYGNLKSFMIMMDFEKLEEYDKWLAYYKYPFHFPYKIKMWQYTSTQQVDGIKGDVDVNLMFY